MVAKTVMVGVVVAVVAVAVAVGASPPNYTDESSAKEYCFR